MFSLKKLTQIELKWMKRKRGREGEKYEKSIYEKRVRMEAITTENKMK